MLALIKIQYLHRFSYLLICVIDSTVPLYRHKSRQPVILFHTFVSKQGVPKIGGFKGASSSKRLGGLEELWEGWILGKIGAPMLRGDPICGPTTEVHVSYTNSNVRDFCAGE